MNKFFALLKSLNKNTDRKRHVTAIIAAAGSGLRMKLDGGLSKQFITVGGKPVILRTLETFDACDIIDDIIVVTRHADIETVKKLTSDAKLTKIRSVILGGKTRQESVTAAVAELDRQTDFVAIHDGARCIVTDADIRAVVASAMKTGAATAANRVTDTLKEVNDSGVITGTPDREKLWSVQTPQVFQVNLYRSSLANGVKKRLTVTDDCALASAAGFRVNVVETSRTNIKITTPEDLLLVEAILTCGGKQNV